MLFLGLPCALLNAHQSAVKTPISYDHVPFSTKTWEEVDLSWENPFDKQHPNTAQLLRPIEYINRHDLSPGNTDVKIDLTEFGVPRAQVWVTDVKPLTLVGDNSSKRPSDHEKNFVIGLYQHEVANVRTYTFMDEKGHETKIHATPNHRFYVLGKGYVPLNQISNKMQLLDIHGDRVSLHCRNKRQGTHCGVPYRQGKKTWVYNIEVYQEHRYFIGEQAILAHNPCQVDYNIDELNDYSSQGGSAVIKEHPTNSNLLVKTVKDIALTDSDLYQEEVDRLDREASLYNQRYGEGSAEIIQDPNGRHGITMVKIPGTPLDELDTLPENLESMMYEEAHALADRGIYHQDLGPGNLLYDGHAVHSIDFGYATAMENPPLETMLEDMKEAHRQTLNFYDYNRRNGSS